MEIFIIYIYTMLLTFAIGIRGRQRGEILIPKFIKLLLLLPVHKEKKVAIYLVIIHSLMQLVTIICVICLGFNASSMQYQRIQKLYGLFMGGICVIITLICYWIYKEKN